MCVPNMGKGGGQGEMDLALGHIFSKLSEVVPATSILGSGKQKAAISQEGSNENVIMDVTHPKTNSMPVHLPEQEG